MAIDIKNLVQIIQKKEHAVTSSTSVQDMIDIMKAAQKAEGVLIRNYDSAGDLPDAATTNERIAYLNDTRTLRFNNGTWDNPLLGAAAAASSGPHYQGSVSGYVSGGDNPGSNVIDKYPFATDANATDVGDLTVARNLPTGQSSSTSGYASGGNPAPVGNIIDKFPFSTDANATDVGDLVSSRWGMGGQSSTTHGYTSGGSRASPSPVGEVNIIEKFPFSVDENSADVGDITDARGRTVGTSSTDNGYTTGGISSDVIDKFPFSTDANATDVGDVLTAGDHYHMMSSSSDTHGYIMGGLGSGNVLYDTIQKFSFSVDGDATDVSNLTAGKYTGSGTSSTSHGYAAGGKSPYATATNMIDKFSFAAETDATDVGDLTIAREFNSGQQV